MDKIKKISISLAVALIILLILNYVIITYANSKYINIPVFSQDLLKGKALKEQDVVYIQVKKTKQNQSLLQINTIQKFQDEILTQNVSRGDIVTLDKVVSSNEVLEQNDNYKYISIPISNLSYPTCSKLKRGELVTVYYTAKNKAVANAIKDKQRLYSNTESDGMVTCLLFEKVEIISVHDSTGKEAKENVITDILVRLNKEDAILVANLKSQGVFDIVLN